MWVSQGAGITCFVYGMSWESGEFHFWRGIFVFSVNFEGTWTLELLGWKYLPGINKHTFKLQLLN